MKTITYQDNMQLWRMESAAEKAGYKKTDDCYWCQIFRNSETGGEFCTSREEDSTNDPAADLAKMLTPSATEEPAEAMRPIMDRLTALKAESIAEADPFITLYITRTGDMIQTGKPAEVTLEEYPEISRTWTRRVAVELPAGFEAAEAGDGRKHIFRGSDCYELTANADGVPCIIDHTQRGGPFIPLPILSEGWGI